MGMIQTWMLGRNDMMVEKEIRYKSVRGCEKRSVYDMVDHQIPSLLPLEMNTKECCKHRNWDIMRKQKKSQIRNQPHQVFPPCFDPQELAFQRKASLWPVRLGCKALSGLWTRWANCGLMPMGDEISISRPLFTLIGSWGPTL